MFKNILLSTALAVSTVAIAQINLDLSLTISHEDIQRNATGSLPVNDNEVTSIVFNGLESLVVDVVAAQSDSDNVIVQTQLLQRNMENDELIPMTDPLAVQVPFGEPATFTINEEQGTGSLVLVIVPSLVE